MQPSITPPTRCESRSVHNDQCDFSRLPLTHLVYMEVTEERKEKLRVILDSALVATRITHAEASRLYGKTRWVLLNTIHVLSLVCYCP